MINVHAPTTPSTQQRLTPRTPTHSSASLPSPLHLSVQAPPSTSTSTSTSSKPTSTSQQSTRRHSAIETTEYARLNAMTNTVSPRDQRDRVLEMKRARKEAEQKQYLAALNEAITTTQMENSRAADRAYHELHPSHQRPGTSSANQHKRQGSAGKDREGSPAQGPLSARNTSPQSNATTSRHPDFRDAFDSSSLDALSPLPSSPLHRHRNTGTIRSSSSSSQLSAAQQEYIQQQQRAGRAHSADNTIPNTTNAPTTVVRSNSRGDDRPIRSSGRYDFGSTQVDVQHSLYGKPEDSDYPDDFENFDIATDDEDEQLVNLLHSATIAEKPTYAFRGYMGTGVSPTSAYTTGVSPTSATTPRGNLHKSTSNHAISKTSRSPSQPNISLLAQQPTSTSISPPSANSSLPTGNTSSIQPSMSHKCEAIKRSALRQLTETEFQEIYQFFKAKQNEESTRGRGLPSPSGSSKVTKAELMNKFGTINSQAVFHIEQLVFLESMLATP